MKLELPRRTERFGAIKINDIQRVLLLDSVEDPEKSETSVSNVPQDMGRQIERNMAIVIPVKDEKLKILEGVLSAIPSECMVIIVSNSERGKVDRFKMECEMVDQHIHYAKRNIQMIHQQDLGLADTLKKLHYNEIIERDRVRSGKAEGMIIGMLLAKAAKKEYIGFIDADNYVPGAVHEYVKIYAAAFYLSKSPYTMVRISWAYKPKVLEGSLYFSKWGRVSEITNRYLNAILASFTGFDTEVVKTGNSGDHAMTMELAQLLDYHPKYGFEVSEFMTLFEKFGGIIKSTSRHPMEKGVEILQIETRNPHFHDEKGEEHLNEMLSTSLSTMISSPMCPKSIIDKMKKEFPKELFHRTKPIRSFHNVDSNRFLNGLIKNNSISIFGNTDPKDSINNG